jgi:hypothetical protein
MRISIVLIVSVILVADLSVREHESWAYSHHSPESGPEAEVLRVRDLGPLKFPRIINGRDGGYSTRFAGRSVWVFGDSILNSRAADGSRWRSSTWCWTRDFDPHNGLGFHEPVDQRGAPSEFLPFTSEESAYNDAHNRETLPDEQRSRWALWPGPIVVGSGTGKAYVFYSKVFSRVGPWAFKSVGRSIAVWEELDRPPVRPQVRPAAAEPTLLFPEDEVPLGAGALVVADWLYAYACRQEGLAFACVLGRAKFAEALTRNAWQFFAGDGKWSSDTRAAVTVLRAAPMLSVHWNEHLSRYLAVYSTPLINTIEIRTALRPEGPWSASRVVVKGKTPLTKTWDYCGMAHAELAHESGRIEYVTYCRETGFLRSELRLVEMTFR